MSLITESEACIFKMYYFAIILTSWAWIYIHMFFNYLVSCLYLSYRETLMITWPSGHKSRKIHQALNNGKEIEREK